MVPVKIHVRHYRALRDVVVPLSNYTALVGPNGVGKSTVLDALDFFLDRDREIKNDDVQRGSSDAVAIAVTFDGLNEVERKQYADALDADGLLTVTKTCSATSVPKYEVLGMRHQDFDELRMIAENGTKTEFNSAVKVFALENTGYGLTAKRSYDENLAELRRWEAENPNECIEAPVTFSFLGSTNDQLISTLRWVYVPAVQDAADTMRDARSPLAQMLKAIVYPRFEADERLVSLRARVEEEYINLFPTEGTPELAVLAERITRALDTFCPGSSVGLGWAAQPPPLPVPKVVPQVVEDGVPTDVEHKGHGLQRALIIAMLQAEDEHRSTSDGTIDQVDVVLMIEEPELYQHPTQCRHFRRVLKNLSSGKNNGLRVVVTTHSPDFISLDDIDAIRIMRREGHGPGVPIRKLSSTTLDEIAARFSEISKKEMDKPRLSRRLHVADEIMREAFFANGVVLVEGAGDYGLLSAQCDIDGIDLEGKGIVIVPCDGKTNIPLAAVILDILGIRHYAVFDGDRDQNQNEILLRALRVPEGEIAKAAASDTSILKTYAILRPRVEVAVRNAIGPAVFDEAVEIVAEEYGRSGDSVLKNPTTAREVLRTLRDKGLECELLHDIARSVAAIA